VLTSRNPVCALILRVLRAAGERVLEPREVRAERMRSLRAVQPRRVL
jgi:hypothetical protein